MKVHYKSLEPLIHWQTQDHPVNWDAVFGRQAPREVEIGFGSGEYLVQRAQEHPDKDFIGIEPAWTSVKIALKRIHHLKLTNVRILFEDARIVLEHCFAQQSLERIYALFPCPWPKDKHVKHRLFCQNVLQLMNSRLTNTGEAYIVTDHEEFYDWIQVENTKTGFELSSKLIPPSFDTHYERKWERHGQDAFYEMTFKKTQHISVDVKEDIPMQTYTVEHFDATQMQFEDVRGPISLAFKETLFDAEKRKGLVRVIVNEPPLTQDLWIEIHPVKKGWKICPSPGSRLIPTQGAQLALKQTYAGLTGSTTA